MAGMDGGRMKIYFIKNKANKKYWDAGTGYRNDFGYSFAPWRDRGSATIYLTKADVFSVYKRGIQEMGWSHDLDYGVGDMVVVSMTGDRALSLLFEVLTYKLLKIEEILASHKLD